jgi:hypothetical protein
LHPGDGLGADRGPFDSDAGQLVLRSDLTLIG